MHKFLEGQDVKNCTKSQKVNFFGMETKFVCLSRYVVGQTTEGLLRAAPLLLGHVFPSGRKKKWGWGKRPRTPLTLYPGGAYAIPSYSGNTGRPSSLLFK